MAMKAFQTTRFQNRHVGRPVGDDERLARLEGEGGQPVHGVERRPAVARSDDLVGVGELVDHERHVVARSSRSGSVGATWRGTMSNSVRIQRSAARSAAAVASPLRSSGSGGSSASISQVTRRPCRGSTW